MPANPITPHHRRSIRFPGYDYTEPGAYFVTICTHHRQPLFGQIVNADMALNTLGQIVLDVWQETPQHFPGIEMDAFIVMPNHIHGIIIINESIPVPVVGAQHAAPLPDVSLLDEPQQRVIPPPINSGSLSAIVRSIKSAVTKRINKIHQTPGMPVWQRNYYEHIIRTDQEWAQISDYILSNPSQWETDPEYFPPNP